MKEQLALLIELQEFDRQLNQYRDEEKMLPERLQVAQQPLEQAKETLARLKSALDQVSKERKEKEQALQSAEEKITKLKGRLTELKTNKEYQTHLHEIESANVEKGKIEEELLVAMDRADAVKKEVAAQEKIVSEEEKKFRAEKEAMESAFKSQSESMKGLEQKRITLSEKVEKKLMSEYKRLAATKRGLAVVALKGNICTGCHFSLPPQLVAEVRKGEKVLDCTYCHRILYVSPA
ncbi:MAG: C4-type zinc ribbon domain-containing protein [Candidatus Manganitrophus sp.]|nr:C4-type zinc ribbon domain-containing protein [Candidatus Manganitrophus sp.]